MKPPVPQQRPRGDYSRACEAVSWNSSIAEIALAIRCWKILSDRDRSSEQSVTATSTSFQVVGDTIAELNQRMGQLQESSHGIGKPREDNLLDLVGHGHLAPSSK